MRKKDLFKIIREELEASLPSKQPVVPLKEQQLTIQEKNQIVSFQYRRVTVMLVLFMVVVSSFFMFGIIPGMVTTSSTSSISNQSTTSTTFSSQTTTTTPVITSTTSRDKTPVDASSVIETFQRVNYTPDLYEILGLNQFSLFPMTNHQFRSPLQRMSDVYETIITDFDDLPITTIPFDEQISRIHAKGNEAKSMVEQAAQIVLLTDTWYHTETASYYMYNEYETWGDSVLIVASSTDYFVYDQKITILYARLRMDNPELVIQELHAYNDDDQHYHKDELYIGYLPNKRYVYYHANLVSGDPTKQSAGIWEIRKDDDVIVITSRDEFLPSGVIELKRYQFHQNFATEVFTNYQNSYLKVYTNQGVFLEKTMSNGNPDDELPYLFGLASFTGWTSIRLVEDLGRLIEAELAIGSNQYSFEDPQVPIQIQENLVFQALRPIRNNALDIIDVQISLNVNPSLLVDDVLSILTSMGLVVHLDGVDTALMIEIIASILGKGNAVFEELTLRGLSASGTELLLITGLERRFTVYMISEWQKDDILSFRWE